MTPFRLHFFVPALFLVWTVPALAMARPSFEGEAEETTRAGHAGLVWTDVDEGADYELQRAATPGFEDAKVIYQGADRGTFVSGLRNGTYHFRVRGRPGPDAAWSDWSEPKVLVVQHWPIDRALGLMGLGALVFALTAGVILVGGRRADARENEEPDHGR